MTVCRSDRSDFDVIVIGAGISGLVSASILVEQGNKRVLVVDDYTHVGGNHIDRTYGDYTFDVGSFIFQDDSPLLRHFPELLPIYQPIDPSWGKLNPQGMITDYPFSVKDDFLAAGPVECSRLALSAAFARLRHRPMRNAKDFAQFWIGPRMLHRSGLENYMERFCGLPAENIDLRFAEKRMLWIAEQASTANLVRRVFNPRQKRFAPVRKNQQLARPREGFSHLYQPIVKRLEQRGVSFALGAGMSSLERVDDAFALQADKGRFAAGRVLSTIPIDRTRVLCGMSWATPLPSVTLISLFFSFSGVRGFQQPILYNFSHRGAWKRLTMYSDFYGKANGREFFTVEVIANRVRTSSNLTQEDIDLEEEGFRRHCSENKLLAGDLRLEGSHTLRQAYPIYSGGAGEHAEKAISELREFGIESFGRQGGFQYQPTARVSTQEAEEALRQA